MAVPKQRQDRQDGEDRDEQPHLGGQGLIDGRADTVAGPPSSVPQGVATGDREDHRRTRTSARARGAVQPVRLEPQLDEHDRDDPLQETEEHHGEHPAETSLVYAGAVRANPPITPPATHNPTDRQAGGTPFSNVRKSMSGFGDRHEDLTDPVPPNQSAKAIATAAPPTSPSRPAPCRSRTGPPSLTRNDPRCVTAYAATSAGATINTRPSVICSPPGQVGELRVQADQRHVDGPCSGEKTRAHDRTRRDRAHHTFSASPDPEEPSGPEDQDEDEDQEREGVLELGTTRMPAGEDQRGSQRLEESSRTPPSAAPEMLPMPPRTAAVTPRSPDGSPIVKLTELERPAQNSTAMPPGPRSRTS